MTRFAQAALAALLINALLLLAASQLVRARHRVQDMTAPTAVSLVSAPREEAAPEEEEAPPPEPPREEPDMDFLPELAPPSLTAPAPAGPAVALDPALFGGPAPGGPLVFEAADLDRPPRTVVRTAPVYPYRAKQRRIEGEVTVRFLVEADGSVREVSILEAAPGGLFEQAVLDAVPGWRFEPGVLAGEPVASWVVTSVVFSLEGDR